jgi:hypothetical protein
MNRYYIIHRNAERQVKELFERKTDQEAIDLFKHWHQTEYDYALAHHSENVRDFGYGAISLVKEIMHDCTIIPVENRPEYRLKQYTIPYNAKGWDPTPLKGNASLTGKDPDQTYFKIVQNPDKTK